MKVTISNIAWQSENDEEMYSFLKSQNCDGIEIAPTRIFPEKPYEDLNKVKLFKDELQSNFGLQVVSLQSICFGKNEGLFISSEEREILSEYVKEAIDFAAVLECQNLVFGSPKNRNINEGQEELAISFFSEILSSLSSFRSKLFSLSNLI